MFEFIIGVVVGAAVVVVFPNRSEVFEFIIGVVVGAAVVVVFPKVYTFLKEKIGGAGV